MLCLPPVILSYDKWGCRIQPWYICSVITVHGVPSPVILSRDKRWCRIQPSYICSVITAHGVPSPRDFVL